MSSVLSSVRPCPLFALLFHGTFAFVRCISLDVTLDNVHCLLLPWDTER
jgi:hypothetical protein